MLVLQTIYVRMSREPDSSLMVVAFVRPLFEVVGSYFTYLIKLS